MTDVITLPEIPFSFANKNGIVLLGEKNGLAAVRCKHEIDLGVLTEVRKHLDCPLDLAFVSDEEFNQLLREIPTKMLAVMLCNWLMALRMIWISAH